MKPEDMLTFLYILAHNDGEDIKEMGMVGLTEEYLKIREWAEDCLDHAEV